jgi:hypothetical protein
MKKIEIAPVAFGTISLHSPKFGLFYLLVIGTSLAWPTLLWADGSIPGNPLNPNSPQSDGSGNG